MEGLHLGGSPPRLPISLLTGSLCCGKGPFGRARALPDGPSSIGAGADVFRQGALA